MQEQLPCKVNMYVAKQEVQMICNMLAVCSRLTIPASIHSKAMFYGCEPENMFGCFT